MKRHKMGRSSSKRNFTKHGVGTHKYNLPSRIVMRGGIRM